MRLPIDRARNDCQSEGRKQSQMVSEVAIAWKVIETTYRRHASRATQGKWREQRRAPEASPFSTLPSYHTQSKRTCVPV
ncbi:hypothetical protein B296_00016521 [Ensete ventricosum]|uniref:Uncharacterized protein n=1 Tax=Ensete ventricosum TaxID=4639 RepID=A0A427A8X7_ENSVE|nr:hypothetical protein B296_00016521 [Ensete ventricosum]